MIIEQPDIIDVNESLRLIKPLKNRWFLALEWYSNDEIMYYSEGVRNKVYDIDTIDRMYSYLSSIGELYFIEYKVSGEWIAIGDVTLSSKNMPIVIGNPLFWSKGIGHSVIEVLINRAKIIGITEIFIPEIFHYNYRSKNLFESFGFKLVEGNNKSSSYLLKL